MIIIILSGTSRSSELFQCFKNYLSLWCQEAIDRAREQVGNVHHLNVVEPDCEDQTFSTEGARNVRAILKSCQTFWQELAWPDENEDMKVATDILDGSFEVFEEYIEQKFVIVQADQVFDHKELIDMLNNLFCSAGFLDDFSSAVTEKYNLCSRYD